jgi:crotonobetainyl-CoA:carnitine CoA-transferase CaiB-like acyl-CoA transferase
MLAPVNDSREIADSDQLQAREFFRAVDDVGRGLRYTLPARFAKHSSLAGDLRFPAPRLGEHNADVYASLQTGHSREHEPSQGGHPTPATAETRAGAPGALEGLKVLELGGGAAGPIAIRHLADHGATVIRIESRSRPDFLRILGLSSANASLDQAPMFMMLNCNKHSVALNLNDPRGIELARRLVLWSDVVAENFAPRAMRKWGLDYESLVKIKPDLIMVSTCLMGQTGPDRDYPGFGGQGAALSGFNALTGWPDREAIGPHGTITDSLAPRFVASALLAAILHRDRTGEGQYLDVSQVETAAYSLSGWMLEYFANGTVVERDGNRSRHAAPHGAFPCAGTDRWITLACHDDEEWRRLVGVMGRPAWALEARFSTLAGRKTSEELLETRIAEWTRSFEGEALVALLQAAGLEAGPVETCADLLADPQLAHRNHFRWLPHPVLGDHPCELLGYRLSGTPGEILRPGPLLGEHSDWVYREILGLDDAEIDSLSADGVLR